MRHQLKSAAYAATAPREIGIGELIDLIVYVTAELRGGLRIVAGDEARDVIQISKVTRCPEYGLHIISRPNLFSLESPPTRLENRFGSFHHAGRQARLLLLL